MKGFKISEIKLRTLINVILKFYPDFPLKGVVTTQEWDQIGQIMKQSQDEEQTLSQDIWNTWNIVRVALAAESL